MRRALQGDGLRSITVKYSGGKLSLGAIDPSVVAKLAKALATVRLPKGS